jgi:hypothetical protein
MVVTQQIVARLGSLFKMEYLWINITFKQRWVGVLWHGEGEDTLEFVWIDWLVSKEAEDGDGTWSLSADTGDSVVWIDQGVYWPSRTYGGNAWKNKSIFLSSLRWRLGILATSTSSESMQSHSQKILSGKSARLASNVTAATMCVAKNTEVLRKHHKEIEKRVNNLTPLYLPKAGREAKSYKRGRRPRFVLVNNVFFDAIRSA